MNFTKYIKYFVEKICDLAFNHLRGALEVENWYELYFSRLQVRSIKSDSSYE